jgi:hypothetical protein
MEEVCVKLGFCGSVKDDKPLHVRMFIPDEGTVTADQFVEWVFLADDMDPNADLKRWQPCKDRIRAAFIACMGGESVDAHLLRWD